MAITVIAEPQRAGSVSERGCNPARPSSREDFMKVLAHLRADELHPRLEPCSLTDEVTHLAWLPLVLTLGSGIPLPVLGGVEAHRPLSDWRESGRARVYEPMTRCVDRVVLDFSAVCTALLLYHAAGQICGGAQRKSSTVASWSIPLHRNSDPATSREAAHHMVTSGQLGKDQRLFYKTVIENPGHHRG